MHTPARKGQVVVVDKLLDTIQVGTRQEFLQLPNNVGNIALLVAPKKGQVVVVEKIACHELWRISRALAAYLTHDVCLSFVGALW